MYTNTFNCLYIHIYIYIILITLNQQIDIT